MLRAGGPGPACLLSCSSAIPAHLPCLSFPSAVFHVHWEGGFSRTGPVLPQVDPSRGGRVAGRSGGSGQDKGAVSSARVCQTRLRWSCWRACPSPALPAHGHWQLQDTGRASQSGTGSPWGAAVAVSACTVPLLYNHREPAQTCTLCTLLGWDLAVPASSPTRARGPRQTMGLLPPPRGTAAACHPHSPGTMETGQSKGPACRAGQGLCAPGTGLRVGVGAMGRGAGVGTPCSPAVCGPQHPALTPSHRHLPVSGSEINSGQSSGSGTAGSPGTAAVQGAPRTALPPPPALSRGTSPGLSRDC